MILSTKYYLSLIHMPCCALTGAGSDIADQVLTVVLSVAMLIGGVFAFILDNTISGKVLWSAASCQTPVCPAKFYG